MNHKGLRLNLRLLSVLLSAAFLTSNAMACSDKTSDQVSSFRKIAQHVAHSIQDEVTAGRGLICQIYRSKTKASFYGYKDRFSHHAPSCGAGYKPSNGMMAAMKPAANIPCGTTALVTDETTGKTIAVAVVDTGGLTPDRSIDIFWPAANELNLEQGYKSMHAKGVFKDVQVKLCHPASS